MKVVVWTKTECPHCIEAKNVLKEYNIMFEERVIGDGYTREQFFEDNPGAKTVPQIHIQQQHIGGYRQLVEYLENTGYNGTGYTL